MKNDFYSKVDKGLVESTTPLNEADDGAVYDRICTYMILREELRKKATSRSALSAAQEQGWRDLSTQEAWDEDSTSSIFRLLLRWFQNAEDGDKGPVNLDPKGYKSNKAHGNQARAQKVSQEIANGNYSQYLDNPSSAEGQLASNIFAEIRSQYPAECKEIRSWIDTVNYHVRLSDSDFGLRSMKLGIYLWMTTNREYCKEIFDMFDAFRFAADGGSEEANELRKEIEAHSTFASLDGLDGDAIYKKLMDIYYKAKPDEVPELWIKKNKEEEERRNIRRAKRARGEEEW